MKPEIEAAQPGVTEPGLTEPEVTRPGAGEPGAAQSGLAMPGDPAEERVRILRLTFPAADAVSIAELAAICSHVSIPGGQAIVVEEEPSDAVYIVLTGIFAAYKRGPDGRDVLLNRITSGAIIGEIGFITGSARTATVRALRDSDVLRISMDELAQVTARHPEVLLAICATVIQRLNSAQADIKKPAQLRTFCLLPADDAVDGHSLIEKLAKHLTALGSATTVTAEQAAGKTSEWFDALEHGFDRVLYLAEPADSAWTKLCLRQSDGVILVVRPESPQAELVPHLMDRLLMPNSLPVFLVLLWKMAIVPGRTTQLLSMVKPMGHFHVRSDLDLARAARLIAGRGIGLVLSGGGARGLAHVGVLTALAENGVPIDVVGGTSIGGIIAGLYAFEWDLKGMARSLVAAFSRRRISDFALPRTALFSERSFTRTLGWLGDTRMEDAPIPMFCVSTNLTRGVSAVHQAGRLQTWLRATAAIPGIFPPVIEEGVIHVDGGVLNNMPIDVVRTFGVCSVIAVDVGSPRRAREATSSSNDPVSLMEILWRVGTIGDSAGHLEADLVLRPEVANMALFGWRTCDEAIAAGLQVARDHLPEITALLPGHVTK